MPMHRRDFLKPLRSSSTQARLIVLQIDKQRLNLSISSRSNNCFDRLSVFAYPAIRALNC